jgi:hypothetical protein
MGWSVSSRFRPNAAVNPLFRSKAEGGTNNARKKCVRTLARSTKLLKEVTNRKTFWQYFIYNVVV